MSKKKFLSIFLALIILGGGWLFWRIKQGFTDEEKTTIIKQSVTVVNKVAQLLPLNRDVKKEIEAADKISQEFLRNDNKTRRYLLLLQNNMELRPGGGFLGQYAVAHVKNGQIVYFHFEDANLLDQRIKVKIPPPYPFQRKLGLKKWKFRDSNFSPDFPENVKQAKRFYRYAGGNSNFDGVFAINATVLNDILEITGPISLYNGRYVYNSQNAILKLEEQVEKPYLFNEDLDTQNRKWIMKKLAVALKDKLFHLDNIPKLIEFSREELNNKNIQLNFQDENLQKIAESVGWAGKVNREWSKDYLMLVDANLGALKTDYYIKRSLNYNVDLTTEVPKAIVDYTYNHTAKRGDWRTSDYHSYLRLYAPKDSKLTKRVMVSYPLIRQEFNKTYFGVFLDALIGRQTTAHFEYDLPPSVKEGGYQLLIQKQSGIGDLPVHVHLKNDEGEFDYEGVVKNELVLEFGEKEIKESSSAN